MSPVTSYYIPTLPHHIFPHRERTELIFLLLFFLFTTSDYVENISMHTHSLTSRFLSFGSDRREDVKALTARKGSAGRGA